MSRQQSASVAALLARARDGDAACKERLFASCRSYLALAARRQIDTWLQAKVDASDLVQQTMLEAHRDFDRFAGASEHEWWAWLKRILARNAADFVRHYKGTRKRQAQREVRIRPADATTLGHYAAEPPARVETPSQQMMRLDEQFRLAAAVDELPEQYREVIVLRNLHRLPFDEIARRMDRSRPAVQMLWMRAVRRLQQRLAEDESTAGTPLS